MSPKILIVDDQADNLSAIIHFIEEDNSPYELLQALDAKLAMHIALNELPDLIITDWEMPGNNGIDLIKELKSNAKTVDIPVIMCTGVMTSSKHLQTALEAGAVDYIRKPIDKIELLARINATLRLSDSYKEIQQLNQSKDRIFSIIAHDLKTPVGNIRNFSQWIIENKEEQEKETLVTLLDKIHRQSSTIYQTLETLLSWARCQNRDILFEPKKSNLGIIILEAEELLSQTLQEKEITFINNFNQDIIASFDPAMIATVVRNLMANAIKFSMPGSRVKVEIQKIPNEIKVCIFDEGVGIEAEQLDALFNVANYHSTFDTDRKRGSGLGLKICKEFISMHKGEIWVESEVGKGSVFCFTIPFISN